MTCRTIAIASEKQPNAAEIRKNAYSAHVTGCHPESSYRHTADRHTIRQTIDKTGNRNMTNQAVNYEQVIPELLTSAAAVNSQIDLEGFDRTIYHLVQLRASQINRCGFCVKMHVREALEDGESNDRLHRLIAWQEVRDFSAREKVALAWTEALTKVTPQTNLGVIRAELREHFSDKEIGTLTCIIAMINFWNRINISRH